MISSSLSPSACSIKPPSTAEQEVTNHSLSFSKSRIVNKGLLLKSVVLAWEIN